LKTTVERKGGRGKKKKNKIKLELNKINCRKKKQKHHPVGVLNFQKAERKWERKAREGSPLGGRKVKAKKPRSSPSLFPQKIDNFPAACWLAWF
jgi:hypothetical protein